VVSAHGLQQRFGATVVLDGASFEIHAGVTGLLGPNGAGKTTLMSMLLGLRRADAGELRVLGVDPMSAGPELRALVGYAPEHHLLPPDLPAHSYVRHLAEVHGIPRRAASTRASDALWWVQLGEERFRALGTLSTGQRQRVKLAAALAGDPRLLLLDEPTDGLDPAQRDAMLALIRRVGHEFGIDVILSSHLLDEVERTCDQIVVLDGGTIVAAGTVDDLRGPDRGLEVVVDGDTTALVEDLRSAGARVEAQGQVLLIDGVADVHRLVRDGIARHRLGLRRMVARRSSLVDVVAGRR
jgi:ABC-2 type transport system ATP-binding protein